MSSLRLNTGVHPTAIIDTIQPFMASQVGPLATIIGDVISATDVVVSSGATLDGTHGQVRLRSGVHVGANSTVVGPAELGSGSRVEAGAVVTSAVPATAIVGGNPAVIRGYADAVREEQDGGASGSPKPSSADQQDNLVELSEVKDLRGDLTVGNFPAEVPFQPSRFFIVHNVPGQHVRGAHAHLQCHQFLVAVHGSLSVVTDDGKKRFEILLDRPSLGLYIPPLVWGVQYKHSVDTVLLVFASHPYDPADYVRDYDDFLQRVRDV